MAPDDLTLPIRLEPRKRAQFGALIGGTIFFGFAVVWTAATAGYFNAGFAWADLKTNWFPLFGLPFLAVGLLVVSRAALSLLPNSPFFHLQIGGEGISTHAFLTRRFYAWRDLPPFEVLEIVRRDEDGSKLLHYAAAMTEAVPPASARGKGPYRREIVRLDPDDYVKQNGEAAAAALADWLNHLRDLALNHKLRAREPIPVPELFRGAARSVLVSPSRATPPRSQTVIRR